MNKAKANYWIDVVIGIAFLGSAVSGLIFLLPTGWGSSVLGISYRSWNDVHTWSSLALIAGVGAHLALHWKWIVAMTRRTLIPTRQPKTVAALASRLSPEKVGGRPMKRRDFLYLGGVASAAVVTAAAGLKTLLNLTSDEASENALNSDASSGGVLSVACPFGLVYDAYPGQCHRYTDADGDGFCDYSVLTGASQVESSGEQASSASEPPAVEAASVACPFGLVYDASPGQCHRYTDADGDGFCDYSAPGSSASVFSSGNARRQRGSQWGQP